MVVLDVDALRRVPADGEFRDAPRLVGRVVEHLDFEPLARIRHRAHRLDEAIGDIHLVVERQLDRDDGRRIERRLGTGLTIAVLRVQPHEVVPVPPVDGENDQNKKVERERERLNGRHVLAVQSFILLLGLE